MQEPRYNVVVLLLSEGKDLAGLAQNRARVRFWETLANDLGARLFMPDEVKQGLSADTDDDDNTLYAIAVQPTVFLIYFEEYGKLGGLRSDWADIVSRHVACVPLFFCLLSLGTEPFRMRVEETLHEL